ncbi:amino acid ABC transporter permease [Roseitranquillus sediminis]|uniref:amino acid ABC transporter permease n=1 Tax=Roseitranquillus sediminis TaxID=2809051 RepID=UPI001D0C63E8|nr:amino acid ABC transporter permease [Roseitranquillus sediminis]MBM9596356.1 amino acid ABC transporter permease [Roseitranquillus sediminis]
MSDTHAQTVAFVRESMVPPADPPLGETGIFKWVRENLFSSWLNVLLSVLSIAFVVWALAHLLPWFLQSVWDAGSLTECREIRDARYGEGAASACFAVITERWNQLLFGFYPPEHYWRPVLAFVLFLVAVSPVLFQGLPRRLLAFTAIYPFIGYWLLWGGTIWGPLLVIAGFVIGWGAFRLAEPRLGTLAAAIAAILLPLAWWFFAVGPIAGDLAQIAPIGLVRIGSGDFGGFMLAFIIGVAGIALSFPLGILLALGRQSHLFIINKSCVGFIEIIRGVPLIVWLFTASLLLNYFLPPGTNFDLMLRVIIMVTLFAAAYMAEVIRGGLAALPRGQYEAADALGLDYWKAMRLIILPQALKISIPGIVNTFIGLFKDTTLVVFIGLLDPIGLSNAIRASTEWNGIYWELFVFIGLLFWICCFSMSRYSMYLERKLETGHR